MNSNQLKYYKKQLDAKNKNYVQNEAYYYGENPTILKDKNLDQYGRLKAQDRRIPLPIGRKLVNTIVGFTFSDIQYSETGNAIANEMNFSNLVSLNNKKIDIAEKTEYFKYIESLQEFNDHDILTMQTAIEACNQGRAYKIWYFTDSMLKSDTVPANQIYAIYTDTLNPVLDKAIRFYSDKKVNEDGTEAERYYADVYSATGIEHHEGKEKDYSDCQFVEDGSITYNEENKIPKKIHITEFNIFRDKRGLIEHIHGMIDEADRVISKSMAEELAGFKSAILLLSAVLDKTYQDENGKTQYDRFMESNIIENFSKDSDFAQWLVKQVDSGFIFGTYDRLKKDIFEFMDIPNFSDAEAWGNTISGVSAAYKLLGFLFLSSQIFRMFSEGLRAEIDLINAYIDLLANNTAVKASMNTIAIKANKVLPKNLLENSQIAATLKGIVSKKTLYKLFPELVENPDEENDAVEGEEEAATKRLMRAVEEPDTTGSLPKLPKEPVKDGEIEAA
jgi:SPP1 family phage portal protein